MGNMVRLAGTICATTFITYIWYRLIMGKMVGPASTICAITYITYIWYQPIMGNMVGPADTICAITYIRYIWYGPIRGIWKDRPGPFVGSHKSRISGTGRSWGIW